MDEPIDSLVDLEADEVWEGGFWPLRVPPGPRGLNPALLRLVQSGEKAIPALVRHLNDPRPTRIVLRPFDPHYGGLFLSDEYDFNGLTRDENPPAVNHGKETRTSSSEYRVLVGDVCFAVVGQITNRRFNAFRYQPSACVYISSPVQSPAIRETCAHEWGSARPEGWLEQSLLADIAMPDTDVRRAGALQRLSIYNPALAEEIAVRELRRPRFSLDLSSLRDRLRAHVPSNQWSGIVEEFRRGGGAGFDDGLKRALVIDADGWNSKEGPSSTEVLAALFPGDDPADLRTLRSAGNRSQAAVIAFLHRVPSKRIDREVESIFQSLSDAAELSDAEDRLALACIGRIRQSEPANPAVASFCRKRAGAARPDRAEEYTRILEALK